MNTETTKQVDLDRLEKLQGMKTKSIFGSIKNTFTGILDAVDTTISTVNNVAKTTENITHGWEAVSEQNVGILLDEHKIQSSIDRSFLTAQQQEMDAIINAK